MKKPLRVYSIRLDEAHVKQAKRLGIHSLTVFVRDALKKEILRKIKKNRDTPFSLEDHCVS